MAPSAAWRRARWPASCAWFDSRLLRLEQGGHQKVLADPRVINAVLVLLAGRRLQARQTA